MHLTKYQLVDIQKIYMSTNISYSSFCRVSMLHELLQTSNRLPKRPMGTKSVKMHRHQQQSEVSGSKDQL